AFDTGDADDLARTDLEIDAVDRRLTPFVFDDEMLELHDGFARTSRLLVDLQHDRPADHQAGEVGGTRLTRRRRRDDFTMTHHGNPVGDVNHFTELVRD